MSLISLETRWTHPRNRGLLQPPWVAGNFRFGWKQLGKPGQSVAYLCPQTLAKETEASLGNPRGGQPLIMYVVANLSKDLFLTAPLS